MSGTANWQPTRHSLRSRLALVSAVALIMVVSGAFMLRSMHDAAPAAPHAVFQPYGTPNALMSGAQLQHAAYETSPGTHLQTLLNATVLGTTPTNYPTTFTVGFQLQNASLLEQILTEQQTPGSPMFHHWLTLQQENQMFAANPVEVQNTINYFTSLGFTVGTRGPISVSFTAPAGLVNQAFKTQMVNVRLGSGALAMMNQQPLSLPGPIANGVTTVNGLDTSTVAHTEHFVDPSLAGDVVNTAALAPTALQQALSTNYLNTSQAFNFTNHAFLWLYYYSHSRHAYREFQTLTPGALDYLYNATQLLNLGYNGNSTGKPITVAIVMAGGINPGDIKGYSQLVFNNPNQLFNRLIPVPVDGAFTDNGTVTYTDGVSNEMALDIDYSGTMAPAAKIMAVYGACLCTNILDDDYATIYQMSASQFPSIVSNSWGGDEDTFGNLYGPNWQNSLTMHYYFGLLDARGATVLASSGDGGGFDTRTGMLAGSYPATDPYVLSVNGIRTSATDTSGKVFPYVDSLGISNMTIYTLYNWPVHVDTAVKIQGTSFWYEPTSNKTLLNAPPQASGGFGTSYWFNQSWFQHGIGVPDLGRALGSGVAAEADFNQTIFFDGTFEFFYGGTSFACPTTAGMFGLIDDYLLAHGHGAYLGDGNVPAFMVANAWRNGNLSLVPYADVVSNGTSYWGNTGVANGWEWPPGQKFPHAAQGWTTYGNTTPGYDFPSGWGVINVYNFAVDLNTLESMPGGFYTTNAAGTAYDTGAWSYMVLNKTYTIHVNASAALAATNPVVTVKFIPEQGMNGSVRPVTTLVATPSLGYTFKLDTSISPFNSPGLIIFEFGNSTNPSLGFSYDWISYPVPTGNLTVQVVAPSQSSEVGGYPQFNPWPFGYGAPTSVSPSCCTDYPNSFTVQVTFNGRPVYNAQVDATIPNANLLAWQGSKLQAATQGKGHPSSELTSTIVSQTFTNMSGFALVQTWNMVAPTTYFVNATYGTAKAGTTYQVTPGPNVGTTDNYGGFYSEVNTVAWDLNQLKQIINNNTLNLWVPNSVNQSGYYDMLYGWQGELMRVHTNDYTGTALGGLHVWFGNIDLGGENKFYHYTPTFGVTGVTNTSGTTGVTDPNGNAFVYIPQNQSQNFFVFLNGTPFSGFGYLAADTPGATNRTFSYTEPCAPTLPSPKTTITCQFNDTYQRNYTSVPMLVLPDPVKAWTQTQSKIQRDFFGVGASINVGVEVRLPNFDPWLQPEIGYNWPSSTEHIVDVKTYIDGIYQGSGLSPYVPPYWQTYNSSVNLTSTFAPGVHTLEVLVNDSVGHIFTAKHTFIVGSVDLTDFSIKNTYTVLPYNLTWSLNIPASQINNHTFNSSLEIRYLTGGCGGVENPCPIVTNFTERIRDGVTDYYQLLNMSLFTKFYSGVNQPPPGQYDVMIWLNANHSGSIIAEVPTSFVFQPIYGQINGPARNEVVPIGNVTISYSYAGDYVQNATLDVFSASDLSTPVFSVIVLVPDTHGLRGSSVTWTAVTGGTYVIELLLGSPYAPYNVTQWINVTETSGLVFLNQSGSHTLGNMNPAVTAVVLSLVSAVLGLLLGLWVAPTFRRTPAGPGPKSSPKPWEEGSEAKQAGRIICPICKDEFATEFALHEHQKISHGIEE